MRVHSETAIIAIVVVSLMLTSADSLILPQHLLTEEEIIAISENSDLVQGLLKKSDWHDVRAAELNQTRTDSSHVWVVKWHIHPRGAPSAAGTLVAHTIDGETGKILSEASLGLR